MQTLYVELVSRINGYVSPLRQAAAATRATTAEMAADLKRLDDAAIAGFRSVGASLAALDEKVIASTQQQVRSWQTAGREIKTELATLVDAQNVASKAAIRNAADQARALRNEAAALPRNDPARQALYLSARDYEDQARALNRMRSDAMQARRAVADVAAVTGGVLVGGIALATYEAVKMQTAMANVATISDVMAGKFTMSGRAIHDQAAQVAAARHNYDAMLNGVLDISRELPQSTSVLAKGLYDIVSSGKDGADALTILHASAVAASAGLTDTATSTKAVMAVINAYGLSAAQATDVTDIMFQTVNKGVVTFEELAHGIGMYAAMAATASGATDHTTKSFAEAEAAMAAMTLAGVPAEQAATALNRVYTQLLHPSAALSGAFRDMGFQSGQQAIQVLGLHGVMERLRKTYGDNATAALKLFPEIRAARGYMAATANEGKNYARVFDSIVDPTKRAAAAQEAWHKQQGTAAVQMKLLENNASAFGIEMGRMFLPALEMASHLLASFVSLIGHVPGPLRDVLAIVALVAGGVLLFGAAWMFAAQKIEAFQLRMELASASTQRVGGLMGMAAKGLGIVTAAITIATLAWNVYESQQQRIKAVTDTLTSAIQNQGGALKGAAVDAAVTQSLIEKGVIGQIIKSGQSVPDAVAAIEAGGNRYRDFLHKVVDSESWASRNLKQNTASFAQSSPFGEAAAGKIDEVRKAWGKAISQSKDAKAAAQETSSAINTETNSLSALSGMTATTGTGVAQLTDEQKSLNDQLEKMVDVGKAAGDALASIQTPGDVFSGLQSTDTKAAAASAKSAASTYKASLKQQVYAAQDHARSLSRAASDASKAEKRSYTDRARAAADYARNLSRSNSAAAKSTKDFAAEGVVSLQQWMDGLDTAGATQRQWDADLHTISQHGGSQELVDSLQGLGVKGVAIVRQMADMSKPQIDRINRQFASLAPNAKASIDAWADTLQRELTMRANYLANLAKLTLHGRGDIVAAIEGITDPAQAAKMAQAAVDASGKQLDRLGKLLLEKTQIAGSDFANGLDILTAIAADKGKATVDSLAKQFTGGDVATMQLMLAQLKTQIKDLATKHHIDLILNASGPQQPIKVHVIPELQGLPGIPGSKPMNTDPSQGYYGLLVRPTQHANGGIVSFAHGSEQHVAQVARPGEWRVWAEPETGGEAYIPLSPSKRRRSVQVLDAVANRFGMSVAPKMAGGSLLDMTAYVNPTLADVMKHVSAVSMTAGAAGAGGGGKAAGSKKVNQWVSSALSILNLPDSLRAGVVSLIMHESGGNPRAVNRWDSNAKAGHPSQGLMQTIPTTFSAYALPGYNSNILDPVSNIIAGVRYAIANYGIGMLMAGGRHDGSGNYIGYASGGINDPYPTPMSFSYSPTSSLGGTGGGGNGMSFSPFLTPQGVLQDYLAAQTAKGVTNPRPPTLGRFEQLMTAAERRMSRWQRNLRTISRKAGSDVAQALADMGADGEKYVNELASKSGKQIKAMANNLGALSAEAATAKASLADFGSQLSAQVDTAASMQKNLEHLASRGYGQLARQIAQIGGPEGAALAGQAAHAGKKKLRHLQHIVNKGSHVLSGQDLDTALQIMAVLGAHHGYGIHDVAAAANVGEDDIIRLANLSIGPLRAMGKASARFRSDLTKANRYQPYAAGGYAPPGSGVQWAEAGAGGEWMIPGDVRKRGRAVTLLKHAAGRFGYGLSPTSTVRAVGSGGMGMQVVVVEVPAQGSSPVIGSLTVQHQSQRASARDIVDEAFHAAKVTRMRRGR